MRLGTALFELLFVIDVQVGTVGYLLTLRPLDAHIRSGNPFLAGWIAALICYPPFVYGFMAEGGIIQYEYQTAGWGHWFAGHDAMLWAWAAWLLFLTAIYGGYFGAGQGVVLLALLLLLVNDDPQRLNGLKNAVILGVNAIAAVIFAVVAPVDWLAVLLLAISSTVGGQLGATVGRRLSPTALRFAIVVLGTLVGLRLLLLP